jgi:hypothetical protein
MDWNQLLQVFIPLATSILKLSALKSGRKCNKLSARGKCVMPNKSIFMQKDGCRAQISSVGRKLLYEIHPWSIGKDYL